MPDRFSKLSSLSISDVWSELAGRLEKASKSDSADAQLPNMSNRSTSLYVTFYGSKITRGKPQQCFETPTIFLSAKHAPLSLNKKKPIKIEQEEATSPTASHFITPSPSSFAHSLVNSPQTSSTRTSLVNLGYSYNSTMRLSPAPAPATHDISNECDLTSEMPAFSLPSSLFDCQPCALAKVLPSVPDVPSADGSTSTAQTTLDPDHRTLRDLVSKFVPAATLSDLLWSAAFAFVVGDTPDERKRKLKDLKSAAIPTVAQPVKKHDSEMRECDSDVWQNSAWTLCRRGAINHSLLVCEDLFSLPSELEHIRAQVQQSECPQVGYTIAPTPFGIIHSAANHVADPVASYGTPPPVLDIERLGHSPNELCYQYYC